MLKSGDLPCLVATSSLELGIDMGAIDLVVQIESPKSVTRGLQRVGRAGHSLGETSKGRIFPKFRSDLLECAVVARLMRRGEIEETVIPHNPLDVLAQHIVSMAALDEWKIDDVEALVTSSESFRDLSREQLENVLDMLDGRYPSERFAELRPRIVWDRTKGTMRGRPGARQLAIANAGTIPDRGLYGVHMPDGRRVGELDEEMVYEARPGQTFLLGATTWRIEDITRDRVIVTPAPGVPGAVPFWRGDGIGRPADLGRAIGAFTREAVNATPKQLAKDNDLDPLAAQNLVNYLTEQQAATRVVPSDENIVVERFRDEIGDWRLCVLSPFGGRVHAAWGLALSAKIRDDSELEADAIWSDDGIVVHMPDADEPPSADLVMLEPDELEDLIVRELARLGPVRRPLPRERVAVAASASRLAGQAHPALAAAPEVPEPARGRPRLPALPGDPRDLPRGDARRARPAGAAAAARRPALAPDHDGRGRDARRPPPSPRRCSSTTSRPTCTRATRRTPSGEAAALALDRDLLRELLGQEELRELIDPDALDDVEASLQQLTEAGRSKRPRRAAAGAAPTRRPDRSRRPRCGSSRAIRPRRCFEKLVTERRAAKVSVGGRGALHRGRGRGPLPRRASGCPPPAGLPDSFLETAREPDARAGPPLRGDPRPLPHRPARQPLQGRPDPGAPRARERPASSSAASCCRGGTEREWCDADVLRRVRRASLAKLRKEVEAADRSELARFLPSWQNVDAHRPTGAGPDRLREALIPLQGVALTPKTWERDVLPRRLGTYSIGWLDELCTSGELVWIGAGSLGRNDGKVALYFREDVHLAGPPAGQLKLEAPQGDVHDAIRAPARVGPSFWLDLLQIDAHGRGARTRPSGIWPGTAR